MNCTPQQCRSLCEAMKEQLPQIIKSNGAFEVILESLTPEQSTVVYEAMKDKLPQIINKNVDSQVKFKFLSEEQSNELRDLMEKPSVSTKNPNESELMEDRKNYFPYFEVFNSNDAFFSNRSLTDEQVWENILPEFNI